MTIQFRIGIMYPRNMVFPGGSVSKVSACNVGDLDSVPGQEDPLEKEMASHSSILASHGQRSLAGCSPWGGKRVRHGLATKQQQEYLVWECEGQSYFL